MKRLIIAGSFMVLSSLGTTAFSQNIENSDRAPVREVDPTTPAHSSTGVTTTVISKGDGTNNGGQNGNGQSSGAADNSGNGQAQGTDNAGSGDNTATTTSGDNVTAGGAAASTECGGGMCKYSWIGLIGLLGLIGLVPRRKNNTNA